MTFTKGHKYYPPYSAGAARHPSIRQQRKAAALAQVATIDAILASIAAPVHAGEKVSPHVATAYAALFHVRKQVMKETR
jgi:hypothetical protein